MHDMIVYFYCERPSNPFWRALAECAAHRFPSVLVSEEQEKPEGLEGVQALNLKAFRKALRRDEPAVVVVPESGSMEAVTVSRLKRSSSVKIVSVENPKIPFGYRTDVKTFHYRRIAFQHIDAFLVLTGYNRRTLESEGIVSSRIHSWTPGLQYREPAENSDGIRNRLRIPENSRIIVSVGPWSPDTFAASLVGFMREARTRLQDVWLVWFAEEVNGRRAFREWTGLMGLREGSGLTLVSGIDHETLFGLADEVVFSPTSLGDPYPIHPFHALMTGKPVHLPDNAFLRNWAKGHEWFYPQDPDMHDWDVRDSPQSRDRRLRLARRLAETHNPGRQAAELSEIFKGVLRFPSRKPADKAVSVIIPTYNRPLHLKRAVESVLNQQGVDRNSVEILVIDDGSDVPVSLAFHPSVHVHRIDHTGKAGKVRNVGLSLARGEIIAYLDSDDRWESGHLRGIFQIFRRHPETGMVITGFRFERLRIRDGRIETEPERPFHPQRVIVTDAVAHRRVCFERLGGFPDLDFQEDYYYWRRLMDHFPTLRIRAKTAVYSFTEGGDNVSFKKSSELRDRYR